jgi:hypothetical protein
MYLLASPPPTQTTERLKANQPISALKVPHLGLHSAAVNENVGLVKCALSRGRRINSVLDVSPHCTPHLQEGIGKNDLVVKFI